MPEDTITIAQISDLHIGPLPHIPWRLLDLKRLTGFLNWHRKRRFMHLPEVAERIIADVKAQRSDHIAVTGDLANIGLPSEIERAASWLRRIGPPETVSVVPGNHDIYSTIGGVKSGSAALASWRPYFTSNDDGRRYTPSGSDFPYVRVLRKGRLGVALIGLNSAVETPPFVATGRLGTEQLGELSRILKETRRDGLVRVVMIHHPPLTMGKNDPSEIADTWQFNDVVEGSGAELIIHGHKHRFIAFGTALFPTTTHSTIVAGVPSASIGVRSRHGDDLACAHYFAISPGASSDTPNITLVARGLSEPHGSVIELNRVDLAGLRN